MTEISRNRYLLVWKQLEYGDELLSVNPFHVMALLRTKIVDAKFRDLSEITKRLRSN